MLVPALACLVMALQKETGVMRADSGAQRNIQPPLSENDADTRLKGIANEPSGEPGHLAEPAGGALSAAQGDQPNVVLFLIEGVILLPLIPLISLFWHGWKILTKTYRRAVEYFTRHRR
jgi:hypothetical protein